MTITWDNWNPPAWYTARWMWCKKASRPKHHRAGMRYGPHPNGYAALRTAMKHAESLRDAVLASDDGVGPVEITVYWKGRIHWRWLHPVNGGRYDPASNPFQPEPEPAPAKPKKPRKALNLTSSDHSNDDLALPHTY